MSKEEIWVIQRDDGKFVNFMDNDDLTWYEHTWQATMTWSKYKAEKDIILWKLQNCKPVKVEIEIVGEIMKAIMISVKPEYVEKILKGEKIGELRTTIPKCELPYKVYLYCTKCKDKKRYSDEVDIPLETGMYMGNGRVVAEWIVKEYDKYTDLTNTANLQRIYERCCVSDKKVWEYSKQGTKPIYDLHIDGLKIYDKPKELNEFSTTLHRMKGKQSRYTSHLLQRPPQSWCYVEELKGE